MWWRWANTLIHLTSFSQARVTIEIEGMLLLFQVNILRRYVFGVIEAWKPAFHLPLAALLTRPSMEQQRHVAPFTSFCLFSLARLFSELGRRALVSLVHSEVGKMLRGGLIFCEVCTGVENKKCKSFNDSSVRVSPKEATDSLRAERDAFSDCSPPHARPHDKNYACQNRGRGHDQVPPRILCFLGE